MKRHLIRFIKAKIVIFSIVCCAVSADLNNDAKALIMDYSVEKGIPVVVTKKAIETYLSTGKKWLWLELNGVAIGYANDQSVEAITNVLNKNYGEFCSINSDGVAQKMSLSAYDTDLARMLKVFPDRCGIDISYPESVTGKLFLNTSNKISGDLACKVLIYGFVLSDLSLKANRNSHILIATRSDILL